MKYEPNGRTKSLVAAGVLVASLAAIPVAASAQSDAPVKDQTAQLSAPEPDADILDGELDGELEDGGLKAEELDAEELDGEEIEAQEIDIAELDEESLAEIQALEEELAAALDEAGIAYEWVDEDGFRYVEIDWEDEAAVEAFDGIVEEVFGDLDFESDLEGDFEGDFDDFEWTEADVADFDAEQNELAAALDEAGIAYEWVDEDGFRYVEIDWEDDAAVEAYFGFYGEDLEDFDLEDLEDYDLEEIELTAEEIAEFNAETEALIEALEADGIPVTVETDEDGLMFFDIDTEDEAVWDRVVEILEDVYGDVVVEEIDGDEIDGDEIDVEDFEIEDLDGEETVDGNDSEG